MPELFLKVFVAVGFDSQVRCRKKSQAYLDALELERRGLVTVKTGTRIDTAFISLTEKGNELFIKMQDLIK